MRYRARMLPLLTVLGALFDSAGGQDVTTTTVTITADVDSAITLVNGSPAGTTPVTVHLPAGRHLITVVDRNLASWFAGSAVESVAVTAGEHRTLHVEVRPLIHVLSEPPEAEVYVGDSLAGTTPVVLRPRSDALPLTLRKPGYLPARGPPDWARSRRPITATLTEDPAEPIADESLVFIPRGENAGDLRLVISGGAALVAGIVAGYCKIRADERSDRYVATGDASVLSERRRLDTMAALALVATQVSLGFFTWFVLSD